MAAPVRERLREVRAKRRDLTALLAHKIHDLAESTDFFVLSIESLPMKLIGQGGGIDRREEMFVAMTNPLGAQLDHLSIVETVEGGDDPTPLDSECLSRIRNINAKPRPSFL